MKTKQEILKELSKDLEPLTKGEKTIITCKETSPLYEVIRECHEDLMPHDWIFAKFNELIDTAIKYDEPEESIHEIIDPCVDVYNHDLFEWLKTFAHYVDDANSEGLIGSHSSITEQVQAAQYYALDIYFNAIMELVDELESEGE